jgi:FimV-like protein
MQSVSNPAARARVLELSSRDKAATVIAPSSPFSSGEPAAAARPSAPAQPAPPPVAAATPPATPAPLTPPSASTTTETPATGATPATGETAAAPATGETATAATPPSGTESTTPAAEGQAPAETATPATTEATPAATTESGEEGGGWVSKLVPILIALIVALIGFAVWRSAREKKAQREYEKASREGGGPSMPAPRVGATGSVGSAKAATSARAELEAFDRQMDDDDATRVADNDATRMVTTSKIAPYTGPQAADRGMDEAELAVTTQFQANTKEIKLGDNDPLSEADFHLAYGLYDEAALLLQQASARAPQRTDLRVKLAETYFAAGKVTEFEQIATGLKGEVGDEEWSKLAILGRQLSPDAAIFQAGDDASSADTVLDLTFDDDATQIAPVKVDEGLEFKLEELELPTRADNAASSRGQALEFDLGEFDLSGTDKTSGSSNKKPAPAPEPLQLKDFDLGGTDMAGGDKGGLDVRLDEVEPLVIDDPSQDEALSSSDDAATKLDLARAYVEMGDSEMARSLLDEVAKIGTDDQKREAGALRERLLG